MSDDSTRQSDRYRIRIPKAALTRRKYVKALGGAGGAGMLAGCGGGGGGGGGQQDTPTATPTPTETEAVEEQKEQGEQIGQGETATPTPSPTPEPTPTDSPTPESQFAPCEQTFATGGVINVPPIDLNFNPYAIQNHAAGLERQPKFSWDLQVAKFVSKPLGLPGKTWVVDNDKQIARYELREGIPWQPDAKHELTAEDVIVSEKINKHMFGAEGDTTWQYADSVEKTGKYSYQYNLKQSIAPIVFHTTVNDAISPAHIYRSWLQKFEDATTDDETTRIKNNLIEMKISKFPPPIGYTVWKPVNRTPGWLQYEAWEEHPDFDAVKHKFARGLTWDDVNQNPIQMLQSGEADSAWVTLDLAARKQLPDYIVTHELPKPQTQILNFNNQHPLLKQREIRQAISYMFDIKTLAKQVFPPRPATVDFTGLPTQVMPEFWLGDIKDKLNDYAPRGDAKAAAAKMREAGFDKQKGKWISQKGKVVSFELISPPAILLDRAASAAQSQLVQFGFDIKLRNLPGRKMWGSVYPNGEFEIFPGPVPSNIPYPWKHYQRIYNNEIPTNRKVPKTFEAPATIGDTESELKEYTPLDMVQQIPSSSREKAVSLVQRLAWIFNYNAISMPYAVKINNNHWDSGNWNIPSKDTEGMGVVQIQQYAPGAGLITPKNAKQDECTDPIKLV